ncbi:hypothetical protein SNE40_013906 [Patella caerulea]|uniref:Uncharacterized protein n=1 Tax=Patella caerulea TaxID=87958 RepID=A0AAN8JGV3_PATCE
MNTDVSTTMRARRVVYDDYTKGFYVESRVEALHRQVDTRAKLTNVLNRSQDCKLNYSKGKVEAARGIFTRKTESEIDHHKGNLKDYVAHRHILDRMAAINKRKGVSSALGKYGVGCAKVDIQPLIDREVKETTPSATRRREAKKLVKKRKMVEVWDRTLNTPELIDAGKNNVQNSRQNTKDCIRKRKSPHIVLPSLMPRSLSTDLVFRSSSSPVKDERGQSHSPELTLPSVFVTLKPETET